MGRRAAATEFRRDFAGIFIGIPIISIAYALGLPSWVGQITAGLACYVGSAPLSRWLLTRIRHRRAVGVEAVAGGGVVGDLSDGRRELRVGDQRAEALVMRGHADHHHSD